MNTTSGTILLFYKYVCIENPAQIKDWIAQLCNTLSLKGRIILAHEGINATVGGSNDACQQFIQELDAHPLFGDIDFKQSPGDARHFPRLKITIRKEIVALGIDPQELPADQGGTHLTPAQVHQLLQEDPEDLVILDARNNYESRIGSFAGAVTPDIENFRDFPAYIDQNLAPFKDKKVLMYCTGGIRCERASAYLKKTGVAKQVYQLTGGIARYVEQFPQGFFKGKNYVFDGRIAMTVTNDVLSHCDWCNASCNEYTNCINASCNKKTICCASCTATHNNTCSINCHDLVAKNQVKIRTKPARIN